MVRRLFFVVSFIFGAIAPAMVLAQIGNFTPVTKQMLLNPDPGDWLLPSRTYDWQRFSPLKQITKQNVEQLQQAWVRGLDTGINEQVPIVYQGVMFVVGPGPAVQALDATNGDLIWEYRRKLPDDIGRRQKYRTIAIFEDLIYFTSPDGFVVGLDARTGKLRWETSVGDYHTFNHTTGPIIVDGRVLTGRQCGRAGSGRTGCFIAAHDALTGEEMWRFYVTPAPGEPGGDSWGSVPVGERRASPWGLPGSYDPIRNLVYWGVANPAPHTRVKRHRDADAVPISAPADLYSNSTVALNPDSGKLAWYYQHLPGDDWDSDHVEERILFRTPLNPDTKEVKWISTEIPRGEERDVVVELGEPGTIFVLDRDNGQFLWATPFPYDVPQSVLSKVDVETGKTFINSDLIMRKDGDKHITCFANNKSYWAMAYHPGKNSLYIPYTDFCYERTASMRSGNGNITATLPRPDANPNALGGIAKVNMETGHIERLYSQRFPGYGAMLATAGNLIFWGDINRRFRAFDPDSGKILWETILGSSIQNSTITYSVNGKQYVAVLTGEGTTLVNNSFPELKVPRQHNAIYVFALP